MTSNYGDHYQLESEDIGKIAEHEILQFCSIVTLADITSRKKLPIDIIFECWFMEDRYKSSEEKQCLEDNYEKIANNTSLGQKKSIIIFEWSQKRNCKLQMCCSVPVHVCVERFVYASATRKRGRNVY